MVIEGYHLQSFSIKKDDAIQNRKSG